MPQDNVGNSRILQEDFHLMMFCRQRKRARISVQKAGTSQQLYTHSFAGIDHIGVLWCGMRLPTSLPEINSTFSATTKAASNVGDLVSSICRTCIPKLAKTATL